MASFVFNSPASNDENEQIFLVNSFPSTPLPSSFVQKFNEEMNEEEQSGNENMMNLLTPMATPDLNTSVSENNNRDTIHRENIPTTEERIRNEIEESERLAWQLMEEESMRAYEMQIEFMRNNPDLFSQEEIQALNSVLQENVVQEDGEEGEEEEEGEGDEEDEDAWSYDRLLEIARVVGGSTSFSSSLMPW
jgi:hypothetical protein